MLVVMIGVAVAVLAGVVVVAVGRGGELAHFPSDHPPLALPDRDRLGASDVALLRLPGALWGYNAHATDAALRRIGDALTARDTRIAILERQVTELGAVPVQPLPQRVGPRPGAGPGVGPRPDAGPAAPGGPGHPGPAGSPSTGPAAGEPAAGGFAAEGFATEGSATGGSAPGRFAPGERAGWFAWTGQGEVAEPGEPEASRPYGSDRPRHDARPEGEEPDR